MVPILLPHCWLHKNMWWTHQSIVHFAINCPFVSTNSCVLWICKLICQNLRTLRKLAAATMWNAIANMFKMVPGFPNDVCTAGSNAFKNALTFWRPLTEGHSLIEANWLILTTTSGLDCAATEKKSSNCGLTKWVLVPNKVSCIWGPPKLIKSDAPTLEDLHFLQNEGRSNLNAWLYIFYRLMGPVAQKCLLALSFCIPDIWMHLCIL